ncbi:hypothetical protein BFP97_16510 [Roseivirga sp. 4D4]|uniref:heavy-metal-associated domain-containing protein n=1 Tax=Roseivirga sp. 4D4 TaxID=1889784 RepID=UPI000853CA4C|nr:heavy-metal-associated domain-containing protein [Roseivirga sp. 4D4]OEK03026.1 hypothetical protein BFP97_16510 [Roseivirga sp. 4D4]
MNTLKFKSNINCTGCLSKVTPFLEKEESIEKWEVDLENPNKLLTIEGSRVSEEKVISILSKVGFDAQPIR